MQRKYLARVTGTSLCKAKSGSFGVRLNYALYADVTGANSFPVNRIMKHVLWVTASCAKNTAKVLRGSFGWRGRDWADLNGTGILNGITVELVCDPIVNDDGSIFEQVTYVNRPGAYNADPALSAEEAQDVDREFGDFLHD